MVIYEIIFNQIHSLFLQLDQIMTDDVIGFKVENILKGNLDSIPSPSPPVKNQSIGGKVYLR